MVKSLQQLRQDAGYKSAREFAKACGFSHSSMTRYEKEPTAIPVKSAWKMADVLGCTIDDIVGRDSDITADLRGEVQLRYDALPESLKASLDDYLGYLEERADDAKDVYRQELEDVYTDMFKLYLVMSMEGMDDQERCDLLLYGATDKMRKRYHDFVCDKVIDRSSNFLEGGEVMEGLMRAYDRFYPEPRTSLAL